MTKKLPQSVRIAAKEYRVLVDEIPERHESAGECDPLLCNIRLARTGTIERQMQSLLHEIIEAVNYDYDMNLEHHAIELLDMALYQVLKDNPGLFD